jgi:hypothetical protein
MPAMGEEGVALCREKLWTENLFKRTWDHFRAKLASARKCCDEIRVTK